MKTIWKYPFMIQDFVELEMPAGARILSVQEQGGMACLWALVDDKAPGKIRRFRVFGTGHYVTGVEAEDHVGTFQAMGGVLVWHVFEVKP